MCAGTALDGVQAALTEINGVELPKQNNETFEAITTQYLQQWKDLGFEPHVCAGTPQCLDAPVSDVSVLIAAGPASITNLMVQRPGGATLPNFTLTLEDLPPRADASCDGACPSHPASLCGDLNRQGVMPVLQDDVMRQRCICLT